MPLDPTTNVYTGNFYGKDRLGHTTPDCDASDPLQPFLPVSYPAPWLPSKRRDDAHPAGANVVVSSHNIIGKDKSGALIPAGYFSGNTGNGGDYCVVKYSAEDIDFTRNAKTGNIVSSASEYVVIAAPNDAAVTLTSVTGTIDSGSLNVLAVSGSNKALVYVGSYVQVAGVTGVFRVISRTGDNCTLDRNATAVGSGAAVTYGLPSINGAQVVSGDISWAHACDLIPGGKPYAVGYAMRNWWQYIGGVDILSTTGGILYNTQSMNPVNYIMHNYMHEGGNAVRTSFVIRVPWIGALPNTLQTKAATLSVAGYNQSNYSRSFSHMVGEKGNISGKLFDGCRVVPSMLPGDAGNYMPYDPAKHDPGLIIGHVLGIEQAHPIKDYADRVRTQFERGLSFKGPFAERNPVTGLMGGSATRGVSTQISVGTDAFYRYAIDQSKAPPEEAYTTVLIRILL